MGTSGAVELELERRESLGVGLGFSSKSQLGTHWLILGGVASKTVVLVQKEKGAAEETILMFVPSSFTLFFKIYSDYHVSVRERERERDYGPLVENTGKKSLII